jgi:Spy/CpxP family protein refolding chaperone
MKRIATFSLLFVTLIWSTSLTARPGRGMGRGEGFGPGKGPRGPCAILNAPGFELSEDQRAAITSTCQEHRETAKPFRQELRAVHEQLFEEMGQDAPDFERVGALHQQIASLKTEAAKVRFGLRQLIREQLTPEQIEAVKALVKERRGRFGKGKRGRGFGGRGFGGQGGPGFGGDWPCAADGATE